MRVFCAMRLRVGVFCVGCGLFVFPCCWWWWALVYFTCLVGEQHAMDGNKNAQAIKSPPSLRCARSFCVYISSQMLFIFVTAIYFEVYREKTDRSARRKCFCVETITPRRMDFSLGLERKASSARHWGEGRPPPASSYTLSPCLASHASSRPPCGRESCACGWRCHGAPAVDRAATCVWLLITF